MDIQNGSTPYQLTEKQKRYLSIKRVIDIILSCGAIIVFAPLLTAIAVAVKLDSPGPILFKQKRVGKNRELFEIYKFRTMRTDTPNNLPTHMLSNPERYITNVGKFLRRTSLDELPQLFNILKGEMYVVSTRPALWNQYDLMEERDKYGVHQIAPGLTGWAQINGRDELEIPAKAKFDGEYIERLGIWMDLKCILGTIASVLRHEGVVEGGTGKIHKREEGASNIIPPKRIKIAFNSKHSDKVKRIIYCLALSGGAYTAYINLKRKVNFQDNSLNNVENKFNIDNTLSTDSKSHSFKRILITGSNSYIGMSVSKWLQRTPNKYSIDIIDMMGDNWKDMSFSCYDVVYHVAGIAHADIGSIEESQKQLYYKVNTNLAIEVADKAKQEGVKQFIFMSSMIIYSGCKKEIITLDTRPHPLNFYGDSKWQADQQIRKLADDRFKVVVLRPPVIYGKGSKGNYPKLAKLAKSSPIFPIIKNERSMLYIDNFCEFIKLMIDNEENGIFFPQNNEYANTSDMVQMIAAIAGHRILMLPGVAPIIKITEKLPGKIGKMAIKAFGNSVYEMSMSEYKTNYRVISLKKSIELTEGDF